MKNRFFVLWAMLGLVSFIAAMDINKSTGSKPVTKDEEIKKEKEEESEYFNILSLDGAGLNGLVTA